MNNDKKIVKPLVGLEIAKNRVLKAQLELANAIRYQVIRACDDSTLTDVEKLDLIRKIAETEI